MEKKITPMGLVTKSATQQVSAYDWKSQGADTVKFGTNGTTWSGINPSDSWTD